MAVRAGEKMTLPEPMDSGSTRLGMEAGQHILVVDDDPQLREMVATALRGVGYSVVTATDGESGWDAMWSGPVDLVITDYSMPNLNGLELLKRMSSSGLMIPAILMSARFPRDISEVLEMLSHGGALHKPFRLEELYLKVGSILDDIRPAYLPLTASTDAGRYKAERQVVRTAIGLRRLRLASKILVYERTALQREGGNSALERVCTKMEKHFLARAGMVGFQMLLAHALVLARREVAWLGPIKISNEGVFRELDQAGAKFGAAEVFQGEVAVTNHLLDLLSSLLGEPMTHARLREVWRDAL